MGHEVSQYDNRNMKWKESVWRLSISCIENVDPNPGPLEKVGPRAFQSDLHLLQSMEHQHFQMPCFK